MQKLHFATVQLERDAEVLRVIERLRREGELETAGVLERLWRVDPETFAPDMVYNDRGGPPDLELSVGEGLDNTPGVYDNQTGRRTRYEQSYTASLQDAEAAGMRADGGPGYGIAYRTANESWI